MGLELLHVGELDGFQEELLGAVFQAPEIFFGVAFLRRVERALRLPAFFPFGLPLRALPRSPWNLRTPPPLGLQIEARYAV
jgi:hypothetical protein